jgi:peptidoglycan hydrolase CwlO-like protein
MLAKEGQDLQDEVNALVAEIDRVNKERDEQNRRYNQ